MDIQKTSCACDLCKVGCMTMPGLCIPGDVEAIAELCGADPLDGKWVGEHFSCSPDGMNRIKHDGGDVVSVEAIFTIVPRQRDNGQCVFFDADELCTVHAAAPAGCRYFDQHQPAAECDGITQELVKSILADHEARGVYSMRAFELLSTGHFARSLEMRKNAYIAAETFIREAAKSPELVDA